MAAESRKAMRDTTRKAMKDTTRKMIEIQMDALKMSTKAARGILDSGYIRKIGCSPISFPVGMLHQFIPLEFCFQGKTQTAEESNEIKYTSTDLPSGSVSDSQDGSLLGKDSKVVNVQNATVERVEKILQNNVQSSKINVSAEQMVTINCPSDLLDNNPFMKEMADVRPYGEDIWKPARVDLTTCANGEKLQYVDKDGNPQDDSCESVEWDDGTKTPDKGGYIVNYYDGSKEIGVREMDGNGERNIRWIYGCCPVADQKVEIKITQITGDMKKLTSTIQNEIDVMNQQSAEIMGCPKQVVETTIENNQEAKIQQTNVIEHHIKQANEQTIIAAQNINYTDYYQMCFQGEPREIKQEIDTKVLAVNIIDSAIKTSMDNKISLKQKSESKVLYYESYTPRIFVLSFILNLIVLGVSAMLIMKLFK